MDSNLNDLKQSELMKIKIEQKQILIAVPLFIISALLIFFSGAFMTDSENQSQTGNQDGDSIAVLETSQGTIKVELFLEQSPITAGNFKKLVEEGFYDGTRFHRVIAGFMIQGGDPNSKDVSNKGAWGTGDPGYKIQDEFVEGLSNVRGTLSMANAGPNSGGSQFFINVADNTPLDWDKQPSTSKHPVFGKVVEGMEVVDAIVNSPTTGSPYDRPVEDVVINKAYIE